MRKYLLVVLSLILVLTTFLTACSDNPKQPQAVISSNNDTGEITNSNSYRALDADTSLFGDFVDGLNNHQVSTLLDLFNEEATLTQVNQFYMGTTHSMDTSVLTASGIPEIKNWLDYQSNAITGITPQEYKVSTNSITLYALFNYTNQVQDIRIDAQIQEGRFEFLYFYIEKISYS